VEITVFWSDQILGTSPEKIAYCHLQQLMNSNDLHITTELHTVNQDFFGGATNSWSCAFSTCARTIVHQHNTAKQNGNAATEQRCQVVLQWSIFFEPQFVLET